MKVTWGGDKDPLTGYHELGPVLLNVVFKYILDGLKGRLAYLSDDKIKFIQIKKPQILFTALCTPYIVLKKSLTQEMLKSFNLHDDADLIYQA